MNTFTGIASRPVDPRFRRPYPHRLKKLLIGRKPVTLAAGLLCSGGIILCADSEFTQGVLKTQGQKILTHRREGLSLAFTGAGDWDYVEMTFQKIVRKFEEQDDPLELNQFEAQDLVEQILLEVYDKNISPVKEEVDFGWLAAIRTPDEDLGLLKSFRSCSLVRSKGFECTGMGEILAKYLSDILYAPNMSLNQGVFLAAYILRLTKRYVTTVGGRSDILALTPMAK